MGLETIIAVSVGVVSLVGSITVVVWTISNRPTFEHCDNVYARKDTYDIKYENIVKLVEAINIKLDRLLEDGHKKK